MCRRCYYNHSQMSTTNLFIAKDHLNKPYCFAEIANFYFNGKPKT